MKFSKMTFVLPLTLAFLCQNPGFADQSPFNDPANINVLKQIQSTNDINDNGLAATAKYSNNSDVNLLRQQLMSVKKADSDKQMINLESSFSAFPQTSTINLTLRRYRCSIRIENIG